MSKSKNNEVLSTTFTQADFDKLTECKAIIDDCQEKALGLAQTIAGQLYIVSKKKLYEIDDYKTIHDWAMDNFDISKGTVSDAINTFERFGDGVTGNLLPQWSEFSYSTLMKMKKLTDEQIAKAGIVPTMSRTQVQDAIKALQALEDKEKELPKFEAEWQAIYKEACEKFPTENRLAAIEEQVPNFLDKKHVATVEEYERLISRFKYLLFADECDNIKEQLVEKIGVEEVEQLLTDCDTKFWDGLEKAKDIMLGALAKLEEQEELEEINNGATEDLDKLADELTERYGDERIQEESDSMPYVVVNINEYRNGNGQLNKKELLARLWEEVQKVEANEIDLLVQKTE